MFHAANWFAGWVMVLTAFVSGAVIGLRFDREDFLGGYSAWRRRLVRLGHIAFAALGAFNVIFSLSPWPVSGTFLSNSASVCWIVGGIAMPVVCFLAAWRIELKKLFFIPVAALILAVALTLAGGLT